MIRRQFNQVIAGAALSSLLPMKSRSVVNSSQQDRCLALLLGGLIGDALGGPMEFSESPPIELCNARSWPEDRRLDESLLNQLADELPLLGYENLRPSSAPYGPWKENAPAGTLTDDSRHKMILLSAIEQAVSKKERLSSQHVAQAMIDFQPPGISIDDSLRELDKEGFQEYRYAARWLLGERDRDLALPPARLWSGVDTCAGQMMFPPLAVAYAGQPTSAYEAIFNLDFIDSPGARDLTAAWVAGMAAVLSEEMNRVSVEQRWQKLFEGMLLTDPYRFDDIPFISRPLGKWLSLSDDISQQANGRPAKLYQLLESTGKPVYWWDAHFTLLVPISILKMCQFNPLAAMHLALDFGHDTDSYAQVLGCMIGAVYGTRIFSQEMVNAVEESLETDYGQNVSSWMSLLTKLQ